MSESMVERVARIIDPMAFDMAFRVADARNFREWTVEREKAKDKARAIIEAMREPTTEMKRGLISHRGYDPDAKEETLDVLGQLDIITMGTYLSAYTAMIDAALKP